MLDLKTNCAVGLIKVMVMTPRVIYLRRKKALEISGLAITVFLLLKFSDFRQRLFHPETLCSGSNCTNAIRDQVSFQQAVNGHRLPDLQGIRRNETWIKLKESIFGKDRLTKVILFSYTRGGSTLLSDIFNIDSNSAYLWYEALQGFHSFYSGIPEYSNELRLLYYRNHTRRTVNARKLSDMTNYLEDLLLCRIEKIPITTLSHVFMTKSAGHEKFWSCIEAQNGSSRLSSCQRMIDLYCYAEEYWSDYVKRNPFSGITKMTCEDLIATIKLTAWKLKPGGDYKVMKPLLKYFEETGLEELASFVRKSCAKLDELSWKELRSPMMERNVLSTKAQRMDSHQNIEDFQECSSMLMKFTKFLRNQECLRDLAHDTRHCRDAISQRCLSANLVAISIHRSSLIDLELLIQRTPDIHIVYYVRDPRAIAASRAEKYLHTYEPSRTWTVVQEVEFICVRMQDDLTALKYLEWKYPGSLIRVRYEDLVRYPVDTVTRMFQYFGRSLKADQLDRWLESVFHAKDDDGMYGVERRNGPAHISKWRSLVTEEDRLAMTEQCRLVLEELQYEI